MNDLFRRLIKTSCVILWLAIVLPVAGCRRNGEADAAPSATLTIAMVPKGSTHEFWKSVHCGGVEASRELGINLLWKGPLREDDREEQIKVLENIVTRGVDGIVLSPLDEVALRPAVANAVRSGIPVLIVDSGLKSDEQISFVATDNYAGGVLAAKHLASLVGNHGRVALLRYAEGSSSTMERERGFLETLKSFPGIKLVSSEIHSGVTSESAYSAAENMLAPLKSRDGQTLALDGIFCPCEPVVFGMLRALEDSGLAGKVRVVGFDASPRFAQAIESGHLDAVVVQDPFRMGYLGVKLMVEHLRGTPIARRVDTGLTLVTKENLQEPAIRERFFPHFERWLS